MQKEGASRYVIKAQVHGGGRGLGHFKNSGLQGGVHVVDSPEKVRDLAAQMCNDDLVTKQSGETGFPCGKVYIVETVNIKKEIYMALTLDRGQGCPVFVYSPEGGMAIEDVAHETPEKIFKIPINVNTGLTESDLSEVAKNLGLENNKSEVDAMFQNIYQLFMERDADMVEINPMVLTTDRGCMAIDGKITCDDNAAFRQKELVEQEDHS